VVSTCFMLVPVCPGEGGLRAALPAYFVLLRGEFRAPVGVCFSILSLIAIPFYAALSLASLLLSRMREREERRWFLSNLKHLTRMIRQARTFAALQRDMAAVLPALEAIHHIGQTELPSDR